MIICCRLSHHTSLELFCLVNAADFSPDSIQNTFSLEFNTYACIKNILMLDLFHLLMLTGGLWIIVMFYQTLILTAPIHCRASVAETHFYKPVKVITAFSSMHYALENNYAALKPMTQNWFQAIHLFLCAFWDIA